MKTVFFLLTLNSFIFSQNYEEVKIEMHGSKFDNYDSIGGYKDGGFRRNGVNLSGYLDKNDTKNILEKKKE